MSDSEGAGVFADEERESSRSGFSMKSPASSNDSIRPSTCRRSAPSSPQAASRKPVRSRGARSSAESNRSPTCRHRSVVICPSPADLLIEPRLGHLPIAHHCLGRDSQDFRGLFYAESSEKTQLDHAALSLINARKLVKRVVERNEIRCALLR